VAGPSVAVRVFGDLTALAGSFDKAASAGSKAANALRSSLGGMISGLNKTGILGPFAGALDGVDSMLGQIGEHGKATGAVMMGVGGTLAGVGVALSALGSKEKASHQQLQQAVENTGKSYETYAKRIEGAEKHNERFGYTSHETADALRVLTQATGDPAKALQLLGTTTDLAAAKHIGLTDAATKLGKVYNGNTKLLKEFGISVAKTGNLTKAAATATTAAQTADKRLGDAKQRLADVEQLFAGKSKLTTAEQIRLRNAQQNVMTATANATAAHRKATLAQQAARDATAHQHDAVTQLAAKLKGQASASADTFTGRLKAMGATVEDAAARFGEKYGPALTVAGTALTALGGATTATKGIVEAFSATQKTATAATEAVTVAEDAEAVSSWAALGPLLLIIAAVAALVVVGYVIYRNWKTIWNGIKAAIAFVWDWIKGHWPLLLGILMGPIGLAVAYIITHWKQVLAGIQAVWTWIKTAWNAVYGWFTAPILSAYNAIVGWFRGILGAVQSVWKWISANWSRIYGWITSVFSNAVHAVQSAMTSIWNAITGVYNWIANNFSRVYSWITKPFSDAVSFVKGLFDGLWSKISGIVSNITGAFSGVYDAVKGAFKGAINGIIDVWNGLGFDMGGWKVGVGPLHYTFPTFHFGMPHIPRLEIGGLITRGGLFELHAGEAVTPAADVGRTAPAVWIEQLHVHETLDVDAFLRRAAFAVARERI